MIAKLQAIASSIVKAGYNGWAALPYWAQKALRDAATVGIITATALVAALDLVFPGSISEARAYGLILWTSVVPTTVAAIVAVLRVELLPPLGDWIFCKLNLIRTWLEKNDYQTLKACNCVPGECDCCCC